MFKTFKCLATDIFKVLSEGTVAEMLDITVFGRLIIALVMHLKASRLFVNIN